MTLHLKELEKEQQIKPKATRRREIIKLREKINNIETKINETKSCFLKKYNKINKHLATLIKEKRERTQINKIMNERGKITTNTTEIYN